MDRRIKTVWNDQQQFGILWSAFKLGLNGGSRCSCYEMKATLAVVLLLSGAAAFLPSGTLVARRPRALCLSADEPEATSSDVLQSWGLKAPPPAPAPAPVEEVAVEEAEEECVVEDVVVGGQLGRILDEIWENRHLYSPCKPVRPRPRSTNNMMKVDVPTQLAKLDELRTKGAIDDEEFAIAKAKVLHLP